MIKYEINLTSHMENNTRQRVVGDINTREKRVNYWKKQWEMTIEAQVRINKV